MRNRRRERYEDQRLDWRDPNMPVIRDYVMRFGERKIIVDADYEHRYREHLMEVERVEQRYPDWRKDPTYNMKRKR